MIYLKMTESNEDYIQKYDLQDLDYPSRADYDMAFGENPYEQLGETVQIYEFYGSTTAHYPYYTMAIYQENWGMTDELKSDYQILVSVDVVTAREAGENVI
jgi:hypothetical protein